MSFTEIPNLQPLNLSPFAMVSGDDDEFVTKMNGLQAALVAYIANFHASIESINTSGTQLAASQVDDAAAITAFEATLNAKVAEIVAATAGIEEINAKIGALVTSDIDGLDAKVSELEGADQSEASARANAATALQNAIDDLAALIEGLEQSDIAGLDGSIAALYAQIGQESSARTSADGAADVRITVLEAVTKNLTTLSNVNLSELQTTADSIAQLIASAGGLAIESIAGLQDELDSASNTAIVQVFEDGGVLTDLPKNKWSTGFPSGAVFDDASLGLRASQMDLIETYKYKSNSVSNGGTSSFEIVPEIQGLHDAMGLGQDGGRRHRPWFYLAKYKVKSALTAYPTTKRPGFYLLSQSGFPAGPGNWLATAYWIRNDTPEFLMIYNAYRIWFNGELVAGYSLVPEGWTHVAILHNHPNGYVNSVAGLYGKPNAEFIMGQPVLTRSKVQLPIHTNPVATI